MNEDDKNQRIADLEQEIIRLKVELLSLLRPYEIVVVTEPVILRGIPLASGIQVGVYGTPSQIWTR